jgi:hypothetical protein
MAKDREPTIRVEGTSPQLDVIPTDYSKNTKDNTSIDGASRSNIFIY